MIVGFCGLPRNRFLGGRGGGGRNTYRPSSLSDPKRRVWFDGFDCILSSGDGVVKYLFGAGDGGALEIRIPVHADEVAGFDDRGVGAVDPAGFWNVSCGMWKTGMREGAYAVQVSTWPTQMPLPPTVVIMPRMS